MTIRIIKTGTSGLAMGTFRTLAPAAEAALVAAGEAVYDVSPERPANDLIVRYDPDNDRLIDGNRRIIGVRLGPVQIAALLTLVGAEPTVEPSPAPVAAPVNTALPAISGTAQEGQTLTVSNGSWTNTPTGYTRQWLRNGSTSIGAGATTYTVAAGDVGATISCRVTASNAGGNSAPSTSAATGAVAAAAGDTRPRFFVAPANAYNTNTAALVAGGTPLTGGANGGKSGTFSLTTSVGNFGWIAVLASAVGAGIRVYDGLGYGGWSGAGLVGNNTGSTTDPSTPTQPFTDASGTWALIRQDYINANPSAANYTVS
jgi:hypothetical protein